MLGDDFHSSLVSLEMCIPRQTMLLIICTQTLSPTPVPPLLGIDALDSEDLLAGNVENLIHGDDLAETEAYLRQFCTFSGEIDFIQ